MNVCGQKHWQVTGAWQETQFLKTNAQETPRQEGLGVERLRCTQEQSQRSVSRIEAFPQIQIFYSLGGRAEGVEKQVFSFHEHQPEMRGAQLLHSKPNKCSFLGPSFHLMEIWISY